MQNTSREFQNIGVCTLIELSLWNQRLKPPQNVPHKLVLTVI